MAAATTLISVDEYLSTTWHPDCDYVDGEIQERNTGELSHDRIQLLIGGWLLQKEKQWRIKAVTEVRLQVRATRFRIPDVMVLSASAPDEEIVRTPPLLCIEILSKDDRVISYMDRLDDYFRMGVPVCWIIDPLARRAWTATAGPLIEPSDGILRAGDIEMPLSDVLEAE
jgi:Uma2 family endonuclease